MTLSAWQKPLEQVRQDLEQIFGPRLRSMVAYDTDFGLDTPTAGRRGEEPPHVHALVLVESLGFADLAACAARVPGWRKASVDTPLVMTRDEFARSLDAFPLEFDAIAARHAVVAGPDPFDGVAIRSEDIRRAIETQAKSHLVHLREAFLETQRDGRQIAALVAASVPSFRALLANVARLDGTTATSTRQLAGHAAERIQVPVELLEQVLALTGPDGLGTSDAERVYAAYLDAAERLATLVDGWKAR